MEEVPMSLLRIYAPLGELPQRCQWAFLDEGKAIAGEGALAELPRGARRVQLVIPAAQVLLSRVGLPRGARRHGGAMLAFAVEAASAAEPEANQVSWLGPVDASAGSADALAVVDRQGLRRWREALEAVGQRTFEVHSEILLLPLPAGEWSVGWDGHNGFVRTGDFEGAATDSGDAASPPLSLRMMLEEAQLRGIGPAAIGIHVIAPGALPDLAAWQRALGVPLHSSGPWDWRTAPAPVVIGIPQEQRRWRMTVPALGRLRPAAWIAATALLVHGAALAADWLRLGGEQRAIRGQMEARFRSTFPDAVAVADPALQMRRQLAAARHRAGMPDSGDFGPMIEQVAAGAKELPPGGLSAVSYESGRMTLELSTIEEPALRRFVARLVQAGLLVEVTGPRRLTVRAT
jgi:general secretion pathway protein L